MNHLLSLLPLRVSAYLREMRSGVCEGVCVSLGQLGVGDGVGVGHALGGVAVQGVLRVLADVTQSFVVKHHNITGVYLKGCGRPLSAGGRRRVGSERWGDYVGWPRDSQRLRLRRSFEALEGQRLGGEVRYWA